jgi:hypothetical protein
MDSQPAPAPGRPLGSVGARGRRQQLVADCISRLGGKERVSPLQMQAITQVVDLTLLASHQRAELGKGRAKVADVVKLEGTLARALKRLALPPPGAAPVQTLQDYIAQHEAAVEAEAGDP